MNKKKTKAQSNTIALNKRAKFDYFIEEVLEAGLVLEGWEVKSIREGKVNIAESYVFIKNHEAFISGLTVTPLGTVSTHIRPEPTRVRKLLLHAHQISRLVGAIERKGYTLVATAMYWSKNRVKCEIGLAKGKKEHDKRATIKEREWSRDKSRILKGR
jgi:SsrA-binding protein